MLHNFEFSKNYLSFNIFYSALALILFQATKPAAFPPFIRRFFDVHENAPRYRYVSSFQSYLRAYQFGIPVFAYRFISRPPAIVFMNLLTFVPWKLLRM